MGLLVGASANLPHPWPLGVAVLEPPPEQKRRGSGFIESYIEGLFVL